MCDRAGENGLDLEALPGRLWSVSNRELIRFGQAARYRYSPAANLGKKPRQVFAIQLKEDEKECAGAVRPDEPR
jgi:hypothetical protein